MNSRGLPTEEIARFGLGYVADPEPGHQPYAGMLAIPYLREHPERGVLVVSIRFRRLDPGEPKYQTQLGDRTRMYNTPALLKPSPVVAITEGEIDAISAELSGIPCVGIPGAQSWQPYFREPFLGYRTVYVLADGDEAGHGFATTVAKSLPNARVIPMEPGTDVNDLLNNHGREALNERISR